MSQFIAKERGPNDPCFVYDEDNETIYELHSPADLAHAERVAEFLQDNVSEAKPNPDSNSMPPLGVRG